MLTILATSARVAPGLLSWQGWTALRGASLVLVGPGEHPQLPALAEAGIAVQVLDGTTGTPADAVAAVVLAAASSSTASSSASSVSASSASPAASASAADSVVWLPPAGTDAPAAELLAALAAAGLPEAEVRVLEGSRDLPGAHLIDVVDTMNTLRTSCPWDRRQTHESLATHLLEEPYEALDALESGDHQALREELGDVLLQVVFHARIAADRPAADDGYSIDDVADTLVAKLVRRHPHVFANVPVDSAEDVTRNWDEIKKAERAAKLAASAATAVASGAAPAVAAQPSVLDGVVLGQPALSLAAQVLRRAGRIGYPAAEAGLDGPASPGPGGLAPLGPDAQGPEPDVGQELLRLVAKAAERGLDPELELRRVARTVADRVRAWEREQS
ncbi:MAG TPA: MazG family protein [Trebonia sp.]|nr:MazG family protein [Trebonia sp.]